MDKNDRKKTENWKMTKVHKITKTTKAKIQHINKNLILYK